MEPNIQSVGNELVPKKHYGLRGGAAGLVISVLLGLQCLFPYTNYCRETMALPAIIMTSPFFILFGWIIGNAFGKRSIRSFLTAFLTIVVSIAVLTYLYFFG